jgi:hypothetical protein
LATERAPAALFLLLYGGDETEFVREQHAVDDAAAPLSSLCLSISPFFSLSLTSNPAPPFSQEPSGTAAVVKFVYGVADLAADRVVAWELFRLFKPYPCTARVSPASPHTPTSPPIRRR